MDADDAIVRMLLAGVGLDDIDDDNGDVVATAGLAGSAHELVGGILWRRGGLQHLVDLIVVDFTEEPIAAEDVAVTHDRNQLPGVDEDLVVDAERSRHDVALRVHGSFGSGEPTITDQRFDQAVILGVLMQAGVGQPIEPAVADIGHPESMRSRLVDVGEHHHGGSHTPELGLLTGAFEDVGVGFLNASDEIIDRADRADAGEAIDGDLGGDLTAVVAAHAVGDDEHGAGDNERVLVVGSDLADIGGCAGFEGGHANSSTCPPTWTRSPGPTFSGWSRTWSLTSVPLVEPRSSTTHRSSRSKMRAWTLETRASSITTAQSEARPMVVSAWSSNTWPATAGGVSTTSREPASLSSSTGAAGGGATAWLEAPLVAGMAAGTGTATRFSVRSSTQTARSTRKKVR